MSKTVSSWGVREALGRHIRRVLFLLLIAAMLAPLVETFDRIILD